MKTILDIKFPIKELFSVLNTLFKKVYLSKYYLLSNKQVLIDALIKLSQFFQLFSKNHISIHIIQISMKFHK